MIKDIIFEQKIRKEAMLKELYIPRYQTAILEEIAENNLVKVILGPRRAGKSFFALHTFKPKSAAYVNFDDENLLRVKNYNDIIQGALEVYGKTKYLLLDEIQNVPQWELLVNRLQRNGYNILVTGSNAKLLSKELATHLTGRHLPVELLPFSLKEFLVCKNFSAHTEEMMTAEKKAELLGYIHSRMRNGGFPELVLHELKPEIYLTPLIESLLFKDVVKRYKLRKPDQVHRLETYLINNVANEFTYERLANNLGMTSWATAVKYLNYLEEAYLLVVLGRYSHKTAQRLKAPKKAYMVDNGFITATSVQISQENGKLMENFVFTELLKRGLRPNRELFYYKTRNDKEIDFAIKEGAVIRELLQVVYDMSHASAAEREVKALLEAADELSVERLTIVTWDEKRRIYKNGTIIEVIPLWEWLIMNT